VQGAIDIAGHQSVGSAPKGKPEAEPVLGLYREDALDHLVGRVASRSDQLLGAKPTGAEVQRQPHRSTRFRRFGGLVPHSDQSIIGGSGVAGIGRPQPRSGVFRPWHFEALRDEVAASMEPVHYAVLRPDGDTCLSRARARVLGSEEHRDALTDEEPIRRMWGRFSRLGPIGRYVIDSSELDPQQTATVLWERLEAGGLRFPDANPSRPTDG
jgi:hypothetical protein